MKAYFLTGPHSRDIYSSYNDRGVAYVMYASPEQAEDAWRRKKSWLWTCGKMPMEHYRQNYTLWELDTETMAVTQIDT